MGMIRLRGNKYWIKYYRSGKACEESADKALGFHGSHKDAQNLLKQREGKLADAAFVDSNLKELHFHNAILSEELHTAKQHLSIKKQELLDKTVARMAKTGFQYPEVPLPVVAPTSKGLKLPQASGIYFLWEKDKIIYVGRANDLKQRLRLGVHHVLRGELMISFLIVPLSKIQFSESYYIGLLKPKENFGATAYHRQRMQRAS